jgi:xeroderma pigmentosum group C-complementing protein
MSLTPLHLQNAFLSIHKQRVPDQTKRGRLFEAAVVRLVEWWSQEFFDVLPTGHIRNRTFEEVQQELEAQGDNPHTSRQGHLDDEWEEGDLEDVHDEVIRSPKSLMKHALMHCGSRDVSAQLFTSLCRALDVPARLVVSLQSVPWQAGVGRPKADGKKSEQKARVGSEEASESDLSSEAMQVEDTELDIKGKGKAKAFPGEGNRLDGGSTSAVHGKKSNNKTRPHVQLRRSRSKGQKLGSSSASTSTSMSYFWFSSV